MLEELFAPEHPSWVRHEECQEFELSCRQRDRCSGQPHLARRRVELQVAGVQDVAEITRPLGTQRLRPAKHRPDPRRELAW